LNDWEEHPSNGNHPPYNTHHQNARDQRMTRSMVVGNGGDRFEERPYKNGGVSREDFGEEVERRRSEVRRSEGRFNDSSSVISNALLSHLTGIHRRPINRVSSFPLCFFLLFCYFIVSFPLGFFFVKFKLIFPFYFLELEFVVGHFVLN
jgi:hypothetical protein